MNGTCRDSKRKWVMTAMVVCGEKYTQLVTTLSNITTIFIRNTLRNKEYLIKRLFELSRGLTRYSTKQTCLSLVSIMHWSERKPRLSILIDILVDWLTAFWQGFKRASLYLKHSVYIDTVMHYCKEGYGILVLEGLLALKDLHHIRILWVVNLWKSYIHHPRCAVLLVSCINQKNGRQYSTYSWKLHVKD